MTPQVEAALIAAFASLVVSLITAVVGLRQASRARHAQTTLTLLNHELAQKEKDRERQRDAKAELDRHREPLLAAVIDVAHRINNIRNRCFFEVYLAGAPNDARFRTTVMGTLYRFAKYWAVVEHLYMKVSILRFESDAQTEAVAQCLKQIGKTYASDSYDGRRLMFWREEQRAVAELMRIDDPPSHLGYESFVEQYESRFASWFADFSTDLTDGTAKDSERLKQLQEQYADLAGLLDLDGLLRKEWEWLHPAEADKDRLSC